MDDQPINGVESSPSTDSDQDFDPTADMLVNDFDDEHTLDEEEEEAINDETNGEEEIDDLQKEGEMPLEELLALYGISDKNNSNNDKNVERVEATSTTPTENHNSIDSIQHIHSNMTQNNFHNSNSHNSSQLLALSNPHSHVTHLRSSQTFTHMNNHNMVSDSSDDESDDDFSVQEEDWRRTIQVGADYQASIPEGLSRYDGAPAYENEDRLIWDPTHLEDKEIEEYLSKFAQNCAEETNGEDVVSSTLLPTGSHIRDDEQALYLLHQCGNNIEEALRRKRTAPNLPAINESMSSWSEEECKAFEAGLRSYGKDFFLVQTNKVRTRSVGELVQFYYLWKKTERHDVFATKFRLEKKKYSLHPGTTDYMDRFLDEQENMALTVQNSLSSSSSSLNNIQSSNKTLHSYRSSPSTQSLNSSPHKSDHILMDDLSTHYANINSFCDSGGSTNSFINGYYSKKTDNVLCNSTGSPGNNSSHHLIGTKVCHSSNPMTSEWVASQQSSVSTSNPNINSPDNSSEFNRRNTISSTTLINDNNIHSLSASNNSNNSNNT